jgi:hypothetical protein
MFVSVFLSPQVDATYTLQTILRAQAISPTLSQRERENDIPSFGLQVSGILEALGNSGSCGLSRTHHGNFRSGSVVAPRNTPKTQGTSFAPQRLGQ